MSCCDGCYTSLFAVIILVNLGCGVCVSATGAFFHDGGNVWAIVIFVLYSLFAAWLLTFIFKEVFLNKNVSSSLNWICGMSSVVTIVVIGIVYILVKPGFENAAIVLAIFIIIVNLFALSCVACCYTNYLRFGLDDRRQARARPIRDEENTFPPSSKKAGGQSNEGMTLEQSLAKVVNHVENNPAHKSYKMYAAGSETPFEVVM